MHVILKDKWFSGAEYGRFRPAKRKGDSIEMPDALRDRLPKSAVVVDGPIEVEVVEEETHMEALANVDLERAAADAEKEALEAAEKAREENLKRIEQKLVADAKVEDKKLEGYKAAASAKKAAKEADAE
jgi:hypothetical protein